jgi:hypothetical protein
MVTQKGLAAVASSLATSPKARKVLYGWIAIFTGAAGFLVYANVGTQDQRTANTVSLSQSVMHYAVHAEKLLHARTTDDIRVGLHDPVFAVDDAKRFRLVGWAESRRTSNDANAQNEVTIHWLDSSLTPSRDVLEFYEAPESLAWVAETLLPPEKRAAMLASFVSRFEQYRETLTSDLEPLVIDSLRDIMPIVQERLQAALKKRQPQMEELALKYEDTLVRQRIVPLIQNEVIPIVRTQAEPLLMKIGEELFESASVWSFTWRYLYDVSPLPQRNLVRREFSRFVTEKAEPIISSHSADILKVAKQISQELVNNAKIKSTTREVASELFHDPQLRQLIADSLAETFADPQPMRDAIRRRWESEQGQRFATNLQMMIEPWFRDLGADLFGTPDQGLTKELVAVLRTQILAKDRRWLVIECQDSTAATTIKSDTTLKLIHGNRLPIYPLVAEAERP